jgi:hypothetical protein
MAVRQEVQPMVEGAVAGGERAVRLDARGLLGGIRDSGSADRRGGRRESEDDAGLVHRRSASVHGIPLDCGRSAAQPSTEKPDSAGSYKSIRLRGFTATLGY